MENIVIIFHNTLFYQPYYMWHFNPALCMIGPNAFECFLLSVVKEV